ncbi:Single-stranded nucleic acid binding R3H [Kalmanozyma brasiliensis GHG001]|uniref:Uncharacterized protein n=1 Tax=Kalmanozyma brasiliensis (strain GHG001) TaxID=1365824 RepID=V5EX62_KALBG|nr:Single-stranded nucleic acid binding R3H [Kalmanozyma brasiliensis GHG001]EST08013.1 Single-stranded nucleic acid binding R3H [Kalmanozyma brasiliensis GHG001]
MMSTDSIHNAFRGINLNDPQQDPRKQQLQQQQQYYQQQQHHTNTSPTRQTHAASFRSPTVLTSDLPGQPGYNSSSVGASHPANAQASGSFGPSAASRFERFFPSSPNATSSNPSSAGQTFTSSMGSAAGHAANSAFGSFGHNIAPGSVGSSGIGSGHFGSNSNGVRKTSSRAAIPSQWSTQDPSLLGLSSGTSPPKNAGSLQSYQQVDPTASGGDDDVIPTAIVVKNIPFSVKREQLLQIIEDLGIPMPYAFNYHFDQGVFRGLAFANFQSAEEADAVVAALNGFDVSGRKLRVEYKKVLQAGEKERIEKEKAIKRMQSMQLEKERRRQNDEYGANAYLMPGYNGNGQMSSDTYAADPAAQQGSFNGVSAPLTADSLRKVPSSQRLAVATAERTAGPLSSFVSNPGASSGGKKEELDLNDAASLEIYSRVLLFKDDRMRDELSFSRSLTPLERRTVHLVAQRLGLFHYSMGEGDERYVIVTKNDVSPQSRPLRSQASTIGRGQRSLGIDTAGASGFLGPGSAATTGRTGLRPKKSAPDMLRDRDGSTGYSASNKYLNNGNLAARNSNTNLRDGYASTSGRRSQNMSSNTGGAAGLQNLFASPFDANANGNTSPTHSNLIRQPRGPPTPGSDLRNFAVRSRVATSGSTGHSSGAGSMSPPPQLHVNGSPTKTDGAFAEATTHDPLEF